MAGPDALQRFIFERARVRGELVILGDTWREVSRRREYPEAVRHALGELTAASALLAATLKLEGGALVLQIQGGHPVDLLVVECQSDLGLRAMARWDGGIAGLPLTPDAPRSRRRGALRPHPRPRVGPPRLPGCRAPRGADDGPRPRALHGALGADHDPLRSRRERRAGRRPPPAEAAGRPGASRDPTPTRTCGTGSATSRRRLTRAELLELPERDILRRLFHEEDLRLFETMPVRFACRCSRERLAGLIRLVGREQVRHDLAAEGGLHVTCEFCGKRYDVSREEAERALADAAGRRRTAPSDPRLAALSFRGASTRTGDEESAGPPALSLRIPRARRTAPSG